MSTWGGSWEISVQEKPSQRPTRKVLTIMIILNLSIRGESECATSLVPSGILLSDECFLTHVSVTLHPERRLDLYLIFSLNNTMEVKVEEKKKKDAKAREEERRAELKRKELEDDEDDEDVERALKAAKQTRIELSRQCPYLDTIDRCLKLDLNFDKINFDEILYILINIC